MAKINALPSLEIINTLKGTLDFYYWKGIPCVRKWPYIPPSRRTAPSLASAQLFGVIVQGWALVGATAKALYIEAARDQPRTGRDLYVSGVLGGQHEASMSDFLDLLTECRDSLAALQALLDPLGSVDTDDYQVDIKSALTTLPVRGEDQLLSLKALLGSHISAAISGAGGYIASGTPAGGQYWRIHTVSAHDGTSACTRMTFDLLRGGSAYPFHEEIRAFAANDRCTWAGTIYLKNGDVIRAHFAGALGGDTVVIDLNGHTITVET